MSSARYRGTPCDHCGRFVPRDCVEVVWDDYCGGWELASAECPAGSPCWRTRARARCDRFNEQVEVGDRIAYWTDYPRSDATAIRDIVVHAAAIDYPQAVLDADPIAEDPPTDPRLLDAVVWVAGSGGWGTIAVPLGMTRTPEPAHA